MTESRAKIRLIDIFKHASHLDGCDRFPFSEDSTVILLLLVAVPIMCGVVFVLVS